MTQEMAEHLRKLTSRNGRYWLRDSRNATYSNDAANTDLPFRSVPANQSNAVDRPSAHESIVVSIPDVGETNASVASSAAAIAATRERARKTATDRSQLAAATQAAAPPQSHAIPPVPHTTKIAAKELATAIPDNLSAGFQAATTAAASMAPSLVPAEKSPAIEAREIQQVPFRISEPEAPAAEPAVEPTTVAPTPKAAVATPQNDEAVKAARTAQSKEPNDSIAKIADQMIERFPVASASVLMTAGTQASLHADETCARIAAELASRNLGRVLLIDSDFVGRRLTKAGGMAAQGGLSEILNIAYPWRDAVLKSGSSKLDFMAAGNCPHKRWTPKSALREAVAEIRAEYQFVCVSVGDAHNSASGMWAEIADGALLVVSATQSSQPIAESAVNELREVGARMIGCIVADVSSQS